MELKMTEIVNWNKVSRVSELESVMNEVEIRPSQLTEDNKIIIESPKYYEQYFYCGVCKEKTVRLNYDEIERRNDYLKKSKSKKDIVDVADWYNRKNDKKESHYWKCLNYCKLECDDELINNVLVFRRLALVRTYIPNSATQHDFW